MPETISNTTKITIVVYCFCFSRDAGVMSKCLVYNWCSHGLFTTVTPGREMTWPSVCHPYNRLIVQVCGLNINSKDWCLVWISLLFRQSSVQTSGFIVITGCRYQLNFCSSEHINVRISSFDCCIFENNRNLLCKTTELQMNICGKWAVPILKSCWSSSSVSVRVLKCTLLLLPLSVYVHCCSVSRLWSWFGPINLIHI